MNRYEKMVMDFKEKYPLEDWDGDGQWFFETVDESDLLEFFYELYDLVDVE